MSPITPDSSLGFLVADAARLMRRNFNRRAQTLGLSLAQARALTFLSKEEGLRLIDLADRLELTPMTIGRLMDGLVELDIVERRADPNDRRATRIFFTPKGAELLKKLWPMALESWQEAVQGLPDAQVDLLCEMLAHMKGNLLAREAANGRGAEE